MTRSAHAANLISGLFAAVLSLAVAGEVAVAVQHQAILLAFVTEAGFRLPLVLGAAAVVAVLILGGLTSFWLQRRRPRRAAGRGRLSTCALAGSAHALGLLGAAAVLAQPETWKLLASGLGPNVPGSQQPAFALASALVIGGGLVGLGASVASWFLLSRTTRRRVFLVIDSALLLAVAWVVVMLPAQPTDKNPDLVWPIVRLAVIALGSLRLVIRALPGTLAAIERGGFTALVAARHLLSQKSGFLTAITLLAIGAVGVSSCTLTTTLSVMGGFRNDLKRKILGNNAHIVVDRDQGRIAGWREVLGAVEHTRQVAGASPYVSGEVMLSSASNLATAVLRGIDPERIGQVNDLPRNLTSGKLKYLQHPEGLLHLPPGFSRDALLLGGSKLERVGKELPPGSGDAGLPDAGLPDAGAPGAQKSDAGSDVEIARLRIEKKLDALETFLRSSEKKGQPAEPRELLPGIVIGQELARALRLYVGDEVNVVAPLGTLGPSGPMPKARPFRVAGIFYSGMYEYDMKFTYVSLEAAQHFLGTGDEVTGIEVRVNDFERAPDTAVALRAALTKGLRVRDWQELNSRLFGALALEKLAMFITLGIAILVASFCIAGTLTLMVQEKGREVAILKAMGTSDRSVTGVFVLEGGLIGLLGATLGLSLGYVLCFAAEHFGIRMNPEVYYIDRLPVQVDAAEFALTGVAAVLVCLAVTIYPALLASRLRPVDALRYE